MLWIVYVLCSVSVFGFTPSKRHKTDGIPNCDVNEVLCDNRMVCPPRTCDSLYTTYSCLDAPPEAGCDCKDGFLRNAAGVCIPKDECPKASDLPTCGCNEVAKFDSTICPPQTCDSLYRFYTCKEQPPKPGCDCVDGYFRNSTGICIPAEECPPSPIIPICGYNEVATTDRSVCPPQICESVYTVYTCELGPPEPGCDCIENHLRNASGICIPSHECPLTGPVKPTKCGFNEEMSDKRITCPPQTCESRYTEYECLASYPEPGCNCISGYLRNSTGICIPIEECPAPVFNITCGPYEVKKEEKTQCPPQTCEGLYSINFCMSGLPVPGCDCIDGYLRDEDDVCIPTDECPIPPGYSDGDFDDGDDDDDDIDDKLDCEPTDDDKQTMDSRSSSETKKSQSHLYDSENSLSTSKAKSKADSSESSSMSKSYSYSSNSSPFSSSSSSSADYEYD